MFVGLESHYAVLHSKGETFGIKFVLFVGQEIDAIIGVGARLDVLDHR